MSDAKNERPQLGHYHHDNAYDVRLFCAYRPVDISGLKIRSDLKIVESQYSNQEQFIIPNLVSWTKGIQIVLAFIVKE